ncbi:MFS transporter, partial [Escherichia coli]|uniref:MFS transporter n=1 Tax=Escherichia coli TaxID=562 RepID=UPI002FE0AECD
MSQHTSDPATLRLPFKEKLSYGIGDLASNILLDIGTLYLLKFYTDELGMPAFYGGIIFLVAKFFTAFTDMLTGVLLDSRRNIGAKGKFRPFILYASVPVALVATAQFMANDFSLTVKT